MFALMESESYNVGGEHCYDSTQMYQNIAGANDYITLNQIVENASSKEFPRKRQVYKVKREV